MKSKYKARRILEDTIEKIDKLEVHGYNKEHMSLIEYGSVMAIICPALDNMCCIADTYQEELEILKSPSDSEDKEKKQQQ